MVKEVEWENIIECWPSFVEFNGEIIEVIDFINTQPVWKQFNYLFKREDFGYIKPPKLNRDINDIDYLMQINNAINDRLISLREYPDWATPCIPWNLEKIYTKRLEILQWKIARQIVTIMSQFIILDDSNPNEEQCNIAILELAPKMNQNEDNQSGSVLAKIKDDIKYSDGEYWLYSDGDYLPTSFFKREEKKYKKLSWEFLERWIYKHKVDVFKLLNNRIQCLLFLDKLKNAGLIDTVSQEWLKDNSIKKRFKRKNLKRVSLITKQKSC